MPGQRGQAPTTPLKARGQRRDATAGPTVLTTRSRVGTLTHARTAVQHEVVPARGEHGRVQKPSGKGRGVWTMRATCDDADREIGGHRDRAGVSRASKARA